MTDDSTERVARWRALLSRANEPPPGYRECRPGGDGALNHDHNAIMHNCWLGRVRPLRERVLAEVPAMLDELDIARAAIASMRAEILEGPAKLRDDDILALAEAARSAICGQPVGFWVDPGAGSAMDRFQRDEPTAQQCADMARRGGHYELLYTGTSVEQMIIHVVRSLSPPVHSVPE